MIDEEYVLLSAQRALLRQASPLLRAVTVYPNQNNHEIVVSFFYDAEIDDSLFDLASCASFEIEMNPEDQHYIKNDRVIALKYPEKIPIQGYLVYLRNEPGCEEYLKDLKKPKGVIDSHPFSALLLSAQKAMLGKVTPNLRYATVYFSQNEKLIVFYIIYHGNISSKDFDLMNLFVKESTAHFSTFRVEKHIKRIDFPANFWSLWNSDSSLNGNDILVHGVYGRYEPTLTSSNQNEEHEKKARIFWEIWLRLKRFFYPRKSFPN